MLHFFFTNIRTGERSKVVVVVIVWQLDLQLPMQSMSITTKVVSSNHAHSEVYSIQHYVIDLSVTCGRHVIYFNIDRQDITEVLLKVALNIITITHTHSFYEHIICSVVRDSALSWVIKFCVIFIGHR